jgi:hypothetical protein
VLSPFPRGRTPWFVALLLATAIALLGAGCTGTAAQPTPTTPPAATTTAIATPTSVPVATFTGCPASGAAIDMCNAMVDIPAWGPGDPDPTCPETAVKLTDGLYPKANGNPADGVQKFVTADVDHDGEPDAIVLLSCQLGDPPSAGRPRGSRLDADAALPEPPA